jgi:transcriptional regulator with XRE-family HTH domain
MIDSRQAAGLTQMEIAARMGTSQSVGGPLESGRHMPSSEMIAPHAAAIGRRFDLRPVTSIGEQGALQA